MFKINVHLLKMPVCTKSDEKTIEKSGERLTIGNINKDLNTFGLGKILEKETEEKPEMRIFFSGDTLVISVLNFYHTVSREYPAMNYV